MVAVPETAGVHWKTRSGEVPELPQLPASVLVPLVVPLKVPPCAAMTVGLLQPPPAARRAVVVVGGRVVVVVVEATGGVTDRGELPAAKSKPSTTTKNVFPALTR